MSDTFRALLEFYSYGRLSLLPKVIFKHSILQYTLPEAGWGTHPPTMLHFEEIWWLRQTRKCGEQWRTTLTTLAQMRPGWSHNTGVFSFLRLSSQMLNHPAAALSVHCLNSTKRLPQLVQRLSARLSRAARQQPHHLSPWKLPEKMFSWEPWWIWWICWVLEWCCSRTAVGSEENSLYAWVPVRRHLCEERSGPCSLLTLRSAQDRELNLKCDYGASLYLAARTD